MTALHQQPAPREAAESADADGWSGFNPFTATAEELDARIAEDNRRIASGERKPYRVPDAEAPGFDPSKTLADWRAEVDGECDEREKES